MACGVPSNDGQQRIGRRTGERFQNSDRSTNSRPTKQNYPTIADAAIWVTPHLTTIGAVTIQLFFRIPVTAKIELKLLGPGRSVIPKTSDSPRTSFCRRMLVNLPVTPGEKGIPSRVFSGLSTRKLFSGTSRIQIPAEALQIASYCRISILAVPLSSHSVINSAEIFCLLMERKKCDIGLGQTASCALGFPLSPLQIEKQLMELPAPFDFRSMRDSVEANCRVRLYFQLVTGKDTPLLAESDEVDE